jgi:multidrug efflux system membrane fusion protein
MMRVLRADADGVVTGVLADTGEVVEAGQPVVRLALDGAREIAVEFPEDRTPLARIGRAEVTLWAQPGVKYPAQSAGAGGRGGPGDAHFPGALQRTGAGQVRWRWGSRPPYGWCLPAQKGGARLPTTALIQDHGQTKVWQYDPAAGASSRGYR